MISLQTEESNRIQDKPQQEQMQICQLLTSVSSGDADCSPCARMCISGDSSAMSIPDPAAGSSVGSTRTDASMSVSRSSISAPARVATSSVWKPACRRQTLTRQDSSIKREFDQCNCAVPQIRETSTPSHCASYLWLGGRRRAVVSQHHRPKRRSINFTHPRPDCNHSLR